MLETDVDKAVLMTLRSSSLCALSAFVVTLSRFYVRPALHKRNFLAEATNLEIHQYRLWSSEP